MSCVLPILLRSAILAASHLVVVARRPLAAGVVPRRGVERFQEAVAAMSVDLLHTTSAIIHKLTADVETPGELSATLRRVVQVATELFSAELCTIFSVNPLTGRFFWPPITAGQLHAGEATMIEPPRADGIAQHILAAELLIVEDINQHPELRSSFGAAEQIVAFAALALRVPHSRRPLALLFINFRNLRRFSTAERAILELLARQASAVLYSSWQLQRYREVARIGQQINQTLDTEVETIFGRLCAHASGIIDTSHLLILAVYQPQNDTLDLYMAQQGLVAYHPRQALPALSAGLVRPRQPLIAPDLLGLPSAALDELRAVSPALGHTGALLSIPLELRDEPYGLLLLYHPQPYSFDNEDQRMLQLLGNHVALALSNIHLYKSLQRLRLLHQAGRELGEVADLADLGQAYSVIMQVARTLSQSQVVIRRYNPDTQLLTVVAAVPDHPLRPIEVIRLGEGVNGRVAQQRRTEVIADVEALAPTTPVLRSAPGERSLLVAPIVFRQNYFGNLTLMHERANHFQDVDVELVEGLATQLGLTIQRLEAARARQEAIERGREAEAMSTIGQAAFELAHRLGNDLGTVRARVNQVKHELRALEVVSATIDQRLDQVVRDVARVLKLSQDLKHNLGNPWDTGDQPVVQRELVVAELLHQAVASFPDRPATIAVQTELPAGLARVRGIPGQVADILRNLLENAFEAMPQGGTLTLRARNTNRYVEIEIADTGVGISMAQQAKIFNLLYSTKGSSGFGLWSARRNALANGGELRVASLPDQGTTFTLSLPRSMLPAGDTP